MSLLDRPSDRVYLRSRPHRRPPKSSSARHCHEANGPNSQGLRRAVKLLDCTGAFLLAFTRQVWKQAA